MGACVGEKDKDTDVQTYKGERVIKYLDVTKVVEERLESKN